MLSKGSVLQWGAQITEVASKTLTKRVRWTLAALFVMLSLVQIYVFFSVDSSGVINVIMDSLPTESKGSEYTLDELLRMPLYERMITLFPYERPTKGTFLEKNIIQTSKDREASSDLMKTWSTTDGFNYSIYDDKMAYRLLLREFGQAFPEVIEAYNNFPRTILRVDFFRYAAVFLLGGTYSDTDTRATKPLYDWVTYNETIYGAPNTAGAVAGIEVECDCGKWNGISSRRVQMCQWTLQARKHHPMYAMLLSNIVELMTNSYNERTMVVTIGDKQYNFSKGQESYYDGIMELTGPAMFTHSVFQYINSLESVESINPNDQAGIFSRLGHPNPEDTTLSMRDPRWPKFGWENITLISQPVLVNGDILILPQKYFNGKADQNADVCLVEHHYYGSWKSSDNGVLDNK
jgi:alpha 1,6-mannosyltransferase